jgi:hypothetical protein
MLLDVMSDGIQTATVALLSHYESPLMAMGTMKSTMTGSRKETGNLCLDCQIPGTHDWLFSLHWIR